MKIEKRNYVKPYTAVMNVQTEGVIATSGEETPIEESAICGENSLLAGSATGCKKNDYKGSFTFVENCQKVNFTTGVTYASCLKEPIFNFNYTGKVTIRKGLDGQLYISKGWPEKSN